MWIFRPGQQNLAQENPGDKRALFLKAGGAFLFLGTIGFLVASSFFFPTVSLWFHGIKTSGTVIGFTTAGNPNHQSIYNTVKYVDDRGSSHTVAMPSFNVIPTGQTISLYYDPNNPNNITQANYSVFGIMFLYLLFVGALLGFGIYFLVCARKIKVSNSASK